MDRVIIDLETTGIDSKRDKIIEIGAVRIDAAGNRREFHTLVDPQCPLNHVITELTGITDEMLVGQPYIENVASDLFDFLANAVPIAHNSGFEAGFLRKYTGYEPEDWLDTITLTKIAFPYLGSYSLANIVQALELLNEEPHRALADARATELLFNTIVRQLTQVDKGIIAALIEILEPNYPIYGDFLRQFDPEILAPRYLPPKVSGQDVEELPPPDENYYLEEHIIKDYLEGEDGLKRYVANYCPRSAQVEMALKVGEAFNDGSFLLAEAGTGTGKTVAYLLPAALMAYYGHARVLLSTHTIHLQDQIINKDLPDINQLFNNSLRSTLVKGRSHYLCYRKWHNAYNEDDIDNPLFMAALLPWVAETQDGDVDVLNLNSYERREWQKYAASSDTCLRGHCPYYRSKCFVHRVRKQAENSHIIVINHSLLLTDSMMEAGTLPHCDYLIIDEAHQLDKVAEENLGYTLTFFDHVALMADTKKFLGQMFKLSAFPGLFNNDAELEDIQEKQDFLSNLLASFDDNAIKGDLMFGALKDCYSSFHESKGTLSKAWRIDRKARQQKRWREAETLTENYLVWINELVLAVKKVKEYFDNELNDEGNEKERYRAQEISCKLAEFSAALYYFIHSESEDMVAWLEQGNERVVYPIMRLSPLKVDKTLAENLYANKESIIFVSATLSVNNKFKYFRENCGLNLTERPCEELLLPSPFDYERQSLLVAIKDTPNVGEVSEYEYLQKLSDTIIQLVTASQGRALVLFTSHTHLREVFKNIEKPLADQGIEVLGHDISGGRNIIIEKMREQKKTVILGANSFWEGIDIAGENLSLLIIVKLPFWPPDMPVLAAKMERLNEEGRNNFTELSLPQAIIRFKQGFGRLLRQEGDRGIVCVLDRRIYEKRYGAQFINSLPIKKIYPATVKEISKIIMEKL